MTESAFRQLLLRLSLVPIFSLIALLVILGVELREIDLLRSTGARATTILLESARLEKNIIDQETGIRGYLAAKNALFLAPYIEASATFQPNLSEIRDTASDNSALRLQFDTIAANYQWFSDINRTLLKGNSSTELTFQLLTQQKQAMDRLRAEFSEVIADQTKLREANRSRLTRILARLPAIGIAGSLFTAILLFWYGKTLFGRITAAFRRQLNETELRRDYFETTLQSIGDAVIVCDASGKVSLMNQAACDATGWSNDQAQGQPLETVFRIVNETTRDTVESPVTKVLRVGSVVGLANHTLLIRRDGTELPIDDSGAPIRDRENEIVGVVLVFRDITERKQHEASLRQSNESRFRLAAIIDSADDAIVSKDLHGTITSWNAAASRMFGYSAAEMLGQPMRLLMPEELQHEEDEILRKIRAGEVTDHYETRRKKRNGDAFDVSVTVSPIRDEFGEIVGASNISRDISNRKQVELLLIRSEKFAATGRMAATIAHEINNPLEALVNLIFLARKNSEGNTDAHNYLLTAESELDRVSHIARQTLGFYRDTGSPTELLLHILIENVLSVYSSKLSSVGVITEKHFNDRRKILVRKGELLQIFSNIITNAADAMRAGGTLTVSTDEVARYGREGIETVIRDSGMGIRPEHLGHIFEPFFTTKRDVGTGIGLWVTKQMVEGRGGRVSVTSSIEGGNRGTVVTVFIPFLNPSNE